MQVLVIQVGSGLLNTMVGLGVSALYFLDVFSVASSSVHLA